LTAVYPCVSQTDFEHIKRILRIGCPATSHWEEPADNKELFIRRGNNPSLAKYWDSTIKTLNKEERNHHILPFQRWVARASAYAHRVLQTIIVKAGKKNRLVWDGKTKMAAHEITMNEKTNTATEAKITLGYVYMAFCIWMFTARISFL